LVLVPALNEEDGIALTLSEFKEIDTSFNFLVVDGNSTDKTVAVAKSLGANVLCQKGKGKGDAIDFAIKNVGSEKYSFVVLTDADYTYPAKYCLDMFKLLEENVEIGMVCGNRFSNKIELGALQNKFYFGNKVITFVYNLLNGTKLCDPLTGLRVIRWDLLKDWVPESDGFDIEIELNHYVKSKGFKITEIEIPYRYRVGQKKLGLRHGFVIMKRIIGLSFR